MSQLLLFTFSIFRKVLFGAGKMAQWLGALPALVGGRGSVPMSDSSGLTLSDTTTPWDPTPFSDLQGHIPVSQPPTAPVQRDPTHFWTPQHCMRVVQTPGKMSLYTKSFLKYVQSCNLSLVCGCHRACVLRGHSEAGSLLPPWGSGSELRWPS